MPSRGQCLEFPQESLRKGRRPRLAQHQERGRYYCPQLKFSASHSQNTELENTVTLNQCLYGLLGVHRHVREEQPGPYHRKWNLLDGGTDSFGEGGGWRGAWWRVEGLSSDGGLYEPLLVVPRRMEDLGPSLPSKNSETFQPLP